MKRFLLCGLTLVVGLSAQNLTIQGSTTVLPIAQHAAEVYMDNNPDADITVRGGGSGTGIAALIDRSTDIASSSRAMKAKEMKIARERGGSPTGTVVAHDGIAVIVHPDNKISNVSRQNLRAIFTGKIARWEKVGGTGGTIVVVSRDAASGTFEVFNEKVLATAKVTDAALMLASNLEIVRTVEQTPGAIGYVGFGYLADKVKAIKVDGVMPSETTVKDDSYPLSRPLYVYTNGKPKGLARDFIDFVLSDAGQKIVKEEGFIPIR
jgi:phosphate transport system substrate-binding protein